jgi:tetratricopeptide (TPR) repeat protein
MIATFFVDSASTEALAATADVSGFDFDRAMERLTDLSLLDVQQADLVSEPRYTLHPLVRAFATASLAEQPDFEQAARERWAEWYVELASQVGWCWDNPDKFDVLDIEHETAYVMLQWALEQQKFAEALQVASGIRYYYIATGLWDRSFTSYILGSNAAKELDDVGTEITMLACGIQLLCRQGDIKKAELYLPRLRQLFDSVTINIDSVALFEYHCAIAWYNMLCESFVTAEQAFHNSLEPAKELVPVYECLGTQWLAVCLCRQGKYTEAEYFFHKAIDAMQGEYSIEHVFSRVYLANLEIITGNSNKVAMWKSDIESSAELTRDREIIGFCKQTFGRFYREQGDLAIAWNYFAEAVDSFKRMGMRRELAEARDELARLEAQMADAAE